MSKIYNSDILPTYVFYDSCFSDLLNKINISFPEEIIGEFRDDKEILDYLYKSELCSLFDEKIEQIEFDQYEILTTLFNNDVMKKCIQSVKDKNIFPILETKEGIYSSIIPLFFSYHLLFFTHLCIQDIISHNGNITENRENLIKDAIERLL